MTRKDMWVTAACGELVLTVSIMMVAPSFLEMMAMIALHVGLIYCWLSVYGAEG